MKKLWMKDLRERAPRVHCITNYVTAGDVANLVLAAGGSPIMAQGRREVEDVTSICHSLVLNMGTLEKRTVKAMLLAGRKARELGHPVILDPVGVTASAYRRRSAVRVLEGVKPDLIRGNASEICALEKALRGQEPGNTAGVDAVPSGEEEERIRAVRSLAGLTGAVVIMTGAVDLIAGREHVYKIKNGSSMMGRITGGGCMLDGLLGAFCGCLFLECREDWPEKSQKASKPQKTQNSQKARKGVSGRPVPQERLEAAVAAAVSAHGLCGEMAERMAAEQSTGRWTDRHKGKGAAEISGTGSGSFRVYFMDVMSCLDDETLERGSRIEIL